MASRIERRGRNDLRGRRPASAAVTQRPRGRSPRWPRSSASGFRAARARTSAAIASAAPGRPKRRAASAIDVRTGSSNRMPAAATSASASNASSGTIRAAPASARISAFAPWCARRVGIRNDHRRDAEGGHLGHGRRAGPPDDQVGGDERGQHVVAQERVRPIARAKVGRELLAGRPAPPHIPDSPLTWSTWTRSTRRGSASATAALNRRTAWDPPKIRIVGASSGRSSRSRAAAVREIGGHVADGRPGDERRHARPRQRSAGGVVRRPRARRRAGRSPARIAPGSRCPPRGRPGSGTAPRPSPRAATRSHRL